jgi:hypothetical protein
MEKEEFNMSHLKQAGMGYLEHFGIAVQTGLLMVFCGLLCIIHGVLPFLFPTAASDLIKSLYCKQKVIHDLPECEHETKISLEDLVIRKD